MYSLSKSCTMMSTMLVLIYSTLFAQNHAPVISLDFPDTVITKQGVSNPDSLFALPLDQFVHNSDGDSLFWSMFTQDSIVAFFDADQETLFVHCDGEWFGRGSFTVRVSDSKGDFDEAHIAVVAFKRDGTLRSADGSKNEYYIPLYLLCNYLLSFLIY